MKHENIEGLIQKALDRELTAGERTELSQHLAQCQECRVYYEQMAALGEECRTLIEVCPLPGLNTRIMRALGIRAAQIWKKIAVVLAGSWAAVVAALLVTPWRGMIINRLLTSMPELTRLVNECVTVVDSLGHFVDPLFAIAGNALQPGIGIVLSIPVFYFFARMIKKEVTCRT